MTLAHNRVSTSSATTSSAISLAHVYLAPSAKNYERSGLVPQKQNNKDLFVFNGAAEIWAPFFCECTDVRVYLRFKVSAKRPSAGNPRVGCQVSCTEWSSILPTRS